MGPARRPLSRAQIEAVASRSVAFFGLLFGVQTFPVMLGQTAQVQTGWFWVYNIAIFGGLLFAVVASIIRRFVRQANIFVVSAYVLALATWPLAVVDAAIVAPARPWLWFLCTVATAAATIAFSTAVAAGYLLLAPLTYGIIRLTPSGGGASPGLAALDTVYAILLGGAVLMIIALLRGASAALDAAQTTALARYAHAVRQHATEMERVQVDSIVHDSVLTTLLSAARAYSPEGMELAATMAGNAVGHLKDVAEAAPDDESMVGVNQLADRIEGATRTLSAPYAVHVLGIGVGSMPVQVAEALYSASVQAMVNSLQHAGDSETVTRWLTITGLGSNGVIVEIGDTGTGFNPSEISNERMGLRLSILERVANAGGQVNIVSAAGEGTVITITWPAQESPPSVSGGEHDADGVADGGFGAMSGRPAMGEPQDSAVSP